MAAHTTLVVQLEGTGGHFSMAYQHSKCLKILVSILVISELVNLTAISLLATWKCEDEKISQPVYDIHTYRNIENGEGCSCPGWTWALLEVLVLSALLIFLTYLAWKLGVFSLLHLKGKRKVAKLARLERLKAKLRLEEATIYLS